MALPLGLKVQNAGIFDQLYCVLSGMSAEQV